MGYLELKPWVTIHVSDGPWQILRILYLMIIHLKVKVFCNWIQICIPWTCFIVKQDNCSCMESGHAAATCKADGSIWIGKMKKSELMSNHYRLVWDNVLHRDSPKEIHSVGKTVKRSISTAVSGCMYRYECCLEVSSRFRNPSCWGFNRQNVEETGNIQSSPIWQIAGLFCCLKISNEMPGNCWQSTISSRWSAEKHGVWRQKQIDKDRRNTWSV